MATPDEHGIIVCPHCGAEVTVDGWREALDLLWMTKEFGDPKPSYKAQIESFLRVHGRLT